MTSQPTHVWCVIYNFLLDVDNGLTTPDKCGVIEYWTVNIIRLMHALLEVSTDTN